MLLPTGRVAFDSHKNMLMTQKKELLALISWWRVQWVHSCMERPPPKHLVESSPILSSSCVSRTTTRLAKWAMLVFTPQWPASLFTCSHLCYAKTDSMKRDMKTSPVGFQCQRSAALFACEHFHRSGRNSCQSAAATNVSSSGPNLPCVLPKDMSPHVRCSFSPCQTCDWQCAQNFLWQS